MSPGAGAAGGAPLPYRVPEQRFASSIPVATDHSHTPSVTAKRRRRRRRVGGDGGPEAGGAGRRRTYSGGRAGGGGAGGGTAPAAAAEGLRARIDAALRDADLGPGERWIAVGVLLLAAALAAATLVGFLYLALAELPESSPSQAAASFRHGTGGPAPYGPLSPLSRLGRTRAERARNLIRALGDRVGGRDGEALAELRRDSRRREERLRREERDMTAIEEEERQREEERRRGREEEEGGGRDTGGRLGPG